MTDEELIAKLRKAASIWFKNSDLILLELFIVKYRAYKTMYEGPAHAVETNIPQEENQNDR